MLRKYVDFGCPVSHNGGDTPADTPAVQHPFTRRTTMAKSFTLAAAASIGLLALSGCSASTGEAEAAGNSSTPTDLVKAGQVTLCIDPEYPPLEYYADGSGGDIVGFDADAGRALADYWGVKVKFEVTSFDGLMPGLQTGRCDIILGGLYTSPARMEVADAAPIMNAGPAALAAPGLASELKDKLDLCGRKVVAQAASSNAATVQAMGAECETAGKKAPILSEYPKTSDTVLASKWPAMSLTPTPPLACSPRRAAA